MTRESCISHAPKNSMAIVREDYYHLMNRDAVAAAILNIFEYWANAAIALGNTSDAIYLDSHPISEFESLLLGLSTDKQIRTRLKEIEARGFIRIISNVKTGKPSEYIFLVEELQKALANLDTLGQTTDRTSVKQPTEPRSNNRPNLGQITDPPSVK